MLGKSKACIRTDVCYLPAKDFNIGGDIFRMKAQWAVLFSRSTEREHNCGLAYERCYDFVTKPTRKQLRKARKHFKIGYDMYENYN